MNTDNELRRMLDERGVNWDYGVTGATTTKFRINGVDLTFMPMRDGLVCTTILTPEQVIAVTLGLETCQLTDNGPWGYTYECSECGAAFDVGIFDGKVNFCPNCGRRVEMVVAN